MVCGTILYGMWYHTVWYVGMVFLYQKYHSAIGKRTREKEAKIFSRNVSRTAATLLPSFLRMWRNSGELSLPAAVSFPISAALGRNICNLGLTLFGRGGGSLFGMEVGWTLY